MKKQIIHILLISICFFCGCVEEIELQTVDFKSALVIEATITNQLKQQQIKLSRTYELEAEAPLQEREAEVRVVASSGETHAFQETEPGIYLSVMVFAAQPNIVYHLEITTSDGQQYASTDAKFVTTTQIDNLYVAREFNENEEEGVSIYVDTFDPTGNSNFYRYEYEETYKIIAPRYSPYELLVNNDDFPYLPEELQGMTTQELIEFFVTRQYREEQELVCYNTVASNSVIIATAQDFEQNAIQQFRVRFISRENYIMSHRYSILVRQILQSRAANEFYETLKDFSISESIFSGIQTGFLNGNVFSVSNKSEPVVGFFEVAAIDEKRVYFNYADLFSGEDLPPYFRPCDYFYLPALYKSDPLTGVIVHSPIQNLINEDYQYFDVNGSTDENWFTPYQLVAPECGDCTFLGDNAVPDFWED